MCECTDAWSRSGKERESKERESRESKEREQTQTGEFESRGLATQRQAHSLC